MQSQKISIFAQQRGLEFQTLNSVPDQISVFENVVKHDILHLEYFSNRKAIFSSSIDVSKATMYLTNVNKLDSTRLS